VGAAVALRRPVRRGGMVVVVDGAGHAERETHSCMRRRRRVVVVLARLYPVALLLSLLLA
jgi:hypothetical protein